jgi:hypothetical protein
MFTVRDVYESVLTELNKKSAPSFAREEFEYFLNKIALFIANEGYQFYAMNGRFSDDYRFLKANESVDTFTTVPKPDGQDEYSFAVTHNYFHMLSCEVYLSGQNPAGDTVVKRFQAKRLTDDAEGSAVDNEFLKPKYNVPYYDVNVTLNPDDPDLATIILKLGIIPTGISINSVEVEYLTLPETITVTDDDIYGTGADNSHEFEFPETLRNKYIGSVTEALLEYANNPRIKTLPPISDDIPPVPVELLTGMQGLGNSQPRVPNRATGRQTRQ